MTCRETLDFSGCGDTSLPKATPTVHLLSACGGPLVVSYDERRRALMVLLDALERDVAAVRAELQKP
jgi:hypothetical protein